MNTTERRGGVCVRIFYFRLIYYFLYSEKKNVCAKVVVKSQVVISGVVVGDYDTTVLYSITVIFLYRKQY